MKFGSFRVAEAEGLVLAHTVKTASATFKKGTILEPSMVETLNRDGIEEVIGARLSKDDVIEDDAAAAIAHLIEGEGCFAEAPFTGRANLFAARAGVFLADATAINELNAISPAITVATLPNLERVEKGRMIATVKIIPLAVPKAAVMEAAALIKEPPMSVAPFRPARVALIQTQLPSVKGSVLDKTRRVLDQRLEGTGSTVVSETRVAHDSEAVSGALNTVGDCDLIVIFGASAVVDREDVLPLAVEHAGGTVRHLGMPVDPGNLLMLAERNGKPVLGAPGCARSSKENGFDWVLNRLLAGIDVTPQDIIGMGVGGLLMEITGRPQPRAPGHET
ncbi:MAG: molybdopterin-binding protein [Pseudomonadota bacterium]